MRLKTFLILALFLFLKTRAFGYILLENEAAVFSLNTCWRNDVVSLKNVVDLDSHNRDDHSTYFGLDYHFGFNYERKDSGTQLYLKLERNGPSDYDAPLWIHNTLTTSGGRIEAYRNDELLPQIEEFWLDIPLNRSLGFKAGLYPYNVGNSLALNGAFENYGFTLYWQGKNSTWRIYYCRPDLYYKNRMGPRIRQDQEQGYVYHHNVANFFAADAKFNSGENYFQPYLGVLADYTSPGKRYNIFTAPIKRDILGTFGAAFYLKADWLSWSFEAAQNFGKAISSNRDYKDLQHTGYLIFSDLDYCLGKFTLSLELLLASGNKVTPEMAKSGITTLTSGKNRAFSVYSPSNLNLGYTISHNHLHTRPLLAMGNGNGLSYGLPRPKNLTDSDFDNLLITSPGISWGLNKKTSLAICYYHLLALEKGVGTFNGQGQKLSRALGGEIDLYLDYQLEKNVLLSFAAGFFFPGPYYREKRDDTAGSVLTPFVRGDGSANSAYQLEFSLEFQF